MYQPLARRYRPQNFSQLVGQRTAELALRNALLLDKVANAIIFAGIRGTGKTTLARILAKALNCERRQDNDPCGMCASCKAIAADCHEDVLEIDGASHTGIEDMRVIKESLACVAQRSPFKVYIIDEVHMLSASAFNSLLKTLEEPRPGVIFIFATTEITKIPKTIRSRCQTFHLQKLPGTVIKERIVHLLNHEKIDWEEDAVKTLASWAEGSMRDALTMLDQVILLGGGTVNRKSLQHITSHLPPHHILDLLEALVNKDAEKIMATLAVIDHSGIEFKKISEELASYARHAFIIKDVGHLDTLADEIVIRLQRIATRSGAFDLNRIFRSLVRCRRELDGSVLDRYVFENYCFEWCFDPGLPLVSPSKTKMENTVLPPTWEAMVERWKKIKPFLARDLEEAKIVAYGPDLIELAVSPSCFARTLLKEEKQTFVADQLREQFAFSGQFKVNRQGAEHTEKKSLLDARNRLDKIHREELISAARDDPLTAGIVEKFRAEVTDVSFNDDA